MPPPAPKYFIGRHDCAYDADDIAERLDEDTHVYEKAWQITPQKAWRVAGGFGLALSAVGWRTVLDPASPLLHRDLRRAVRCGVALTELVKPGEDPVVVDIGLGETAEVARPTLGNDIFDSHDLRDALCAAVICRDREGVEELCRVDARVPQIPGSIRDNFNYTFIQFLQAALKRAPWTDSTLAKAKHDSFNDDEVDYARYMGPDWCAVFEALYEIRKHPSRFDYVLAAALEKHKRYYGEMERSPGKHRRGDPRGFVPLALIAAAVMACDRGHSTLVTSDYLPRLLVEGPATE